MQNHQENKDISKFASYYLQSYYLNVKENYPYLSHIKKKIRLSRTSNNEIHNDTGSKTIWQNIGTRSFYGPWDVSVKRNGDHVDYNDYGVRIEHFRPNLLSYDDVPMSNGYIDALPSVYNSGLSEFKTLFSSVGLADFRTGVRTGLDQSKY